MKIKKINEMDIVNDSTKHFAIELSQRIGKTFFSELSEFNRIEVEVEKHFEKEYIKFYFCFSSILPDTITNLEKCFEFLKFNPKGWGFQIGIIGKDIHPKAFIEFHLNLKDVRQHIKKFELLDNIKNFNI